MIAIAFVLGFIIGCNFQRRAPLRGSYRPNCCGTVSPLDDGADIPKTVPHLQSGVSYGYTPNVKSDILPKPPVGGSGEK